MRRSKPAVAHDPPLQLKRRKSPPYPFLLEALAPLDPEVRPMFSGYAVYIGDKIVAMLRDRPGDPPNTDPDNGVWLVFAQIPNLADRTLRREFPSLRPIRLLGGKIAHWLLIPSDSPTFETDSLHACDLIIARDPRIGRIPESRRAKPRKSK